MSDRTFSLEEAQSLLPVLESLLRTAIAGKKIIEEVEAEQQALSHRIFLNGGMFLDVVPLARRKAERVKAEQRAKDAVAEIDSIGVQVKDIDIGLLDFPCEIESPDYSPVREPRREPHPPLAGDAGGFRRAKANRRADRTGEED